MMRGRRPPGITDSVENCGTELDKDSGAVVSVGIPVEVTGSGVIELGDNAVVSAGVSVEVTGSGIIELGDNSGTVVSAGVSMEITGSADKLSLI